MEDIYTIVDKAIDVAFEEQKFHLKFYDLFKRGMFLLRKSKKTFRLSQS